MIADGDYCAFRVLGPVEVFAFGKPLKFARRQQLDLLAFLMLRADRAAATGEIVEAMWGGAAPRTAGTQVQNMLSALRSVLRHDGQTLARVDRTTAGYALHVITGELDLASFTRLVSQARSAHAPDVAVELLREAMSLWRGASPLAGVHAPFATAARAYLAEQRDNALEQLFGAELSVGNHAAIVPALTDAVAANPVRQRFVAQLMLALHRSGRTTDALGAYRNARQTLSVDYGLEIGRDLRDLERRILLGDRALEPPVPGGRAVIGGAAAPSGRLVQREDPPVPVPAQLPLDARGFVGREAELAQLNALLANTERTATTVVTVLMGTAGVGKTALAVHWGHQVASAFPDGQLYVNLRGIDPSARPMDPSEALLGFLDALGVARDRTPSGTDAQAALYRSLVAGRRILVLLDNALDAEQVRPLLPGASGGLVLVTSRNQLSALVALEGAHPVTLDVLSESEARELLVARLGLERVAADVPATDEIATRCARLPLALAMVAARAAIHPDFPLRALSTELIAVRDRLGERGVDAFTADVQAAFSWSYRSLTSPAANMFRLLGSHPGPHISVAAAASLTAVHEDQARDLLAELARAHLITEHLPGRYSLHDLLRSYAAKLAQRTESAEQRRAAVARMLSYYLHSAYAAALIIYPHRYKLDLVPAVEQATVTALADPDQALDWFTGEHRVLLATLNLAAEEGFGAHAWQLASAMSTYLDRRGHWHDWVATQQTALAVAERNGDEVGQAHAHGSLGLAYNRLKQFGQAQVHLRHADEFFGKAGDLYGQAYTHLRMSLVFDGQGDRRTALHHVQLALDRFESAGHPIGAAQALNNIGWLHALLGQYAEAVQYCARAVEVHRELGDQEGMANALDSLGFAHHSLGNHRQAAEYYRQALVELRQMADPYYETITLAHLGDTHFAAGDRSAARIAWRQALVLLDELGHTDAVELRAKLEQLGDELGV